jgi:vancomycin resistance protein YoaR
MKNRLIFWSFIAFCVSVWIISGYFVAVNTILKNQPLAKVLSLHDNQTAIYVSSSADLSQLLPATLTITLNGQTQELSAVSLNLKIDEASIKSYGKGNDLTQVLSSGAQAISGTPIKPDLVFDLDKLASTYNVYRGEDGVYLDLDGYAYNCYTRTFDFNWRTDAQANLNQRLKNNQLQLQWEDVITPASVAKQIEICNISVPKIADLAAKLSELPFDWSKSLVMNHNQEWKITNSGAWEEQWQKYAANFDIQPQKGEFIDFGAGKLAMLKPVVAGRKINTAASTADIINWINSSHPTKSIALTIQETPVQLPPHKQLLDFTQVYAQGKTRIDIIRNGRANFTLPYAQSGVLAINNSIVMPGQEFSYINAINPQPRGWMANGSPIGGGICNATTTLFRAALESGFPITERHAHGFYVPSYEWGYQMNIVDAAYYTNPRVDFKFINDLNKPILLQTTITRPGDGWQYHTISVRTANDIPKRKVVLKDWRKTQSYTVRRFTGEFVREVWLNDQIVRKDKFISRYTR